ncbi:hypothetical protein F5Y14DRAFT_266914 [Nemania sp. NC0429]|nr:hypothetical protein F5Y14DRAFT_266914 [Nemania sp. NC0429]
MNVLSKVLWGLFCFERSIFPTIRKKIQHPPGEYEVFHSWLTDANVTYQSDVRSQELFTRISIMLQAFARVTPLVKFMLLGIHVSVRSLDLGESTPEDAKPCYEGLGDGVDTGDIPIDLTSRSLLEQHSISAFRR